MRFNIMILSVVLSCTSKKQERQNNEAIILHNSMMKKASHIEHRLNEIKRDSTVSQDSIALLDMLLQEWKAELVEVPGNDNHDHHGHAHNHVASPNVTDEQMLQIQRALDQRLSAIGKRIAQLKPEIINNDHEH